MYAVHARRLFKTGLTVLSLVAPMAVLSCTKPKEPTPELADTSTAAKNPAAGTDTPAADGSTAAGASDGSAASVSQFSTVYFEFDSSILSSATKAELRKTAEALRGASSSGKNIKLQLEGHCDERGSPEYNLALGERRAKAVQDFLVGEGVPSSMLSTISYGEERPAVQGTGESVWAKNRRVEGKEVL